MQLKLLKNQSFELIESDLLLSKDRVIVHQINCLCVRPHGLAKAIAKRFPYSDIYSRRRPIKNRNLAILEDRGIPGEIDISISGDKNNPIVVGLYGQYDYGKPGSSAKRSSLEEDNFLLREKWFLESLRKLYLFLINKKIDTVGFPYKIGCGLAGGNWNNYTNMLNKFAHAGVGKYRVNVYKLP